MNTMLLSHNVTTAAEVDKKNLRNKAKKPRVELQLRNAINASYIESMWLRM